MPALNNDQLVFTAEPTVGSYFSVECQFYSRLLLSNILGYSPVLEQVQYHPNFLIKEFSDLYISLNEVRTYALTTRNVRY